MDDKHSFIGKQVRVTNAPNKGLVGLYGNVINETRYAFVLDTNKGRKTVLKFNTSLELENKNVTAVTKRMEDRIKSR